MNEDGYWIYYHVKVNITENHLEDKQPFINADFVCTFQRLDKEGKKATGSTETIKSVFGEKATEGKNLWVNKESGAGKAAKDTTADLSEVEWSTAKGDPAEPQELEPSLRVAIVRMNKAFNDLEINQSRQTKYLRTIFPGINNFSNVYLKVLVDPDYDLDIANQLSDFGGKGDEPPLSSWNTALNNINANAKILTLGINDFAELLEAELKEAEPQKRTLRLEKRKAVSEIEKREFKKRETKKSKKGGKG